jgi:hypothetical protein
LIQVLLLPSEQQQQVLLLLLLGLLAGAAYVLQLFLPAFGQLDPGGCLGQGFPQLSLRLYSLGDTAIYMTAGESDKQRSRAIF